MALWRVNETRLIRLPETRLKAESFLEKHLENWIIQDPSILGEPLLVIGRQVLIPDVKDRLDVLAIDQEGNAVIVELKRGRLRDPVDMQALRYASYISKWSFEDFENTARRFLCKNAEQEFNFNEIFESFCKDSGDEIPMLNQEQRIVIVGSSIKEKLGSVAVWLRQHRIDITVIEIEVYKDGRSVILQPNTIVPYQVARFAETGRIQPEGAPWVVDGKQWHLKKRCKEVTRRLLLTIDNVLHANFDLDGTLWNQKHYIRYRISNQNWLKVKTAPTQLEMQFSVPAGRFDPDEIAKRLGVSKYEGSLAEKLNLPSSVLIENENQSTDRITLRIKEDFDPESKAFVEFLSDLYDACSD